jgi:hypothetical protein
LAPGFAVQAQTGRADPLRAASISVLDRKRLEKRASECHAVVKKEYDRLLPKRVAT